MVVTLQQTALLPFSRYHHYQRNNFHNHHPGSSGATTCMGAVTSFVYLAAAMMFLIISFVITPNHLSGGGVDALSCSACDLSLCPNTDSCPGGLTKDVCGCCPVCARVRNQRCGGMFGIFGRCDRELHCFIRSEDGHPITGKEEGVCKGQELICNDNCPAVHEPKLCPPDSFLTTSDKQRDHTTSQLDHENIDNTHEEDHYFTNDDASIENSNFFLLPDQTSYCLCNVSGCQMPECATGYTTQLIRLGTGVPGACCNVFVCRKSEGCQYVICPPYEADLCPEDSVRIPSEWTEDGCCEIQHGCTCKFGDQCEPVWCSEGLQVEITSRSSKLPGACCDRFRCVKEKGMSCFYNGHELENGQTWQTDNCKTCECRDGLGKCKDTSCQNLACTWMVIPEGQCCPVCRGCVSDSGNLYNDSDVWQENDCTTCTCKGGQAHCQSEMCAVQCSNPKHVPGQCCPVCQDEEPGIATNMCHNTEECSIICKHGLEQTPAGCFLCVCKEEKCHLDCQFGLKADVEGNTVCECKGAEDKCPPWEEKHCGKKCEYGYKQTRDGCFRCKCRKCPQFNCNKRCVHGHVLNDEGCPLCKCKEISIPERIGFNFEPDNIEGKSCLTWHGSRHDNGESWHDGCRLCYCHNGAEMCALIACPIPYCSNPVFRIGDCCPTCPGYTVISVTKDIEMCESSQGQHYVEGELWKMDLCTQCICHRGTILCETPSCPPIICHHPIKPEGQCCAICRGSDIVPVPSHSHQVHCTSPTGILYKHGEVWRSTPCQSCVCRNGQMDCFNQMCPPLKCNRAVQRKGYCCPTCVETSQPKICTNSGVTYIAGEKWHGDNCTECSCLNGQTICSPLTCPHLECTILIRKINQCCPQCSDQAHLQSHIQRGIGLYKDNSLSNNTALSKTKSGIDGNIVGITVLGVLVFVLATIIFILILYLMTWRHLSLLRQRPKSTDLKLQSQMPFHHEQTVNSEKEYFTQLSLGVTSENGKTDRTSNVYTEMIFSDQTKDCFGGANRHLLSKIT